jgi:excinuclease ABC subunit C
MSIEIVRNYLRIAPNSSGVYQFFNSKHDVIYIGKAKNLRNRLANYTTFDGNSNRICHMITNIDAIDIIKTNNELEALLLEANLIKKFKPRYNILLKDHKSFTYLLIREDHPYPQIAKYRGIKDIKGSYYGPFISPTKAEEALSYLQKIFLVRSCADAYFASRKRSCLLYQIKRCSAPCVNKIAHDDYLSLVKQAKDFLSGKNSILQKQLAQQMHEASERYAYEEASQYRDRIKMLSYIQAKQIVDLHEIGDLDVIAVDNSGGIVAVQIFFFRTGQNLGNKTYFPEHAEEAGFDEVLSNFILQFYQHNHIPPLIALSNQITDSNLLQQALAGFCGHKVKIEVPKQGKKYELIKFALNNIKSEIEKKLNTKTYHKAMLKEMELLFGLQTEVKRVEIYDNSHISGKFAVGAMVVSGEDGFEKKEYRKYNITHIGKDTGGDDYSMMKEMLTRRFKRDLPKPELILIDGGAGHLSVAHNVIKTLRIEGVFLVGIAKGVDRNAGRESFFTLDKGEFTLDKNSKIMKYLQILRDEAHRFAITTHRAKRSAAIKTSVLNMIPGIGGKRKKILLSFFGSVEHIENASIDQLQQVETINRTIAEKIYRYFHK